MSDITHQHELDEEDEAEELREAFHVLLSLARENMLDEDEATGDEDLETCRKIQHEAFQLVYSYLENEEVI